MARRVTPEDIIRINEVYYTCKNYTKTAEATGWSASTVKKYIDPNFVLKNIESASSDESKIEIKSINEVVNLLSTFDRGLCILTFDEMKNLPSLWEELIV